MIAVAPRISTTVPVDPAASGSQASSSCADQISPASFTRPLSAVTSSSTVTRLPTRASTPVSAVGPDFR